MTISVTAFQPLLRLPSAKATGLAFGGMWPLHLRHDAEGDGVQAPGETQTLNEAGIMELNYALGRYTRYGEERQLASPDLRADAQGSRLAVVPEGILLESSNGQLSLFTGVRDLSQVGDGGGPDGEQVNCSLSAANDPYHRIAA